MKAYIMGNYTAKAFQGFLKDPYDFIVVSDVPSFDDFAAIKLVVEASGAVENLTMLEAIDFNKATSKASKIGYKAPGQ